MPSHREPSQPPTYGQLELIQQFQDRPISLADASLIAAAETLNLTRAFAYDSGSGSITMRNGAALQICPQGFLSR